MSRLIRLDRSGHTTLAEWSIGDQAAYEAAARAFALEVGRGMIASAATTGGAEVVRELPRDAELVVMRRQIAGG